MPTRYDAGIQTFDTANVRAIPLTVKSTTDRFYFLKVYSNGLSEEILGKAIKKFDLPRDEIVVMTKVSGICPCHWTAPDSSPASRFSVRYAATSVIYHGAISLISRLQVTSISMG